jgi:hypothetical protein
MQRIVECATCGDEIFDPIPTEVFISGGEVMARVIGREVTVVPRSSRVELGTCCRECAESAGVDVG